MRSAIRASASCSARAIEVGPGTCGWENAALTQTRPRTTIAELIERRMVRRWIKTETSQATLRSHRKRGPTFPAANPARNEKGPEKISGPLVTNRLQATD